MKLRQRIRLKETEAEQARRALDESIAELKRVLHYKLSSRTALILGFGGGWLLGWRARRAPSSSKARRARTSHMPRHWLRSYFVWPFLLRTARDYLAAYRPSRREA